MVVWSWSGHLIVIWSSIGHMVIWWSYDQQTDQLTDRPTDRVRYRAAGADYNTYVARVFNPSQHKSGWWMCTKWQLFKNILYLRKMLTTSDIASSHKHKQIAFWWMFSQTAVSHKWQVMKDILHLRKMLTNDTIHHIRNINKWPFQMFCLENNVVCWFYLTKVLM